MLSISQEHNNSYGPLIVEGNVNLSDFYKSYGETLRTVLSIGKYLGRKITRSNIEEQEKSITSVFRECLVSKAKEEGILNILYAFIGEKSSKHFTDQDIDSKEIGDNTTKISIPSSGGVEIKPEVIYERRPAEDAESNTVMSLHWLLVPLRAVQKNRMDIIKLCDKTGMPLENFKHHKGYSLLHEAYCKKDADFEMIMFLLGKIDVNVVSDDNESILQHCLQSKYLSPGEKLERIEHLLANGADATIQSNLMGSAISAYLNTLFSVLHIRDMDHWKTIIGMLLQEGVDINQQDSYYQTALTSAICAVPPFGHEETLGDETVVQEQLAIRKQKLEIVKYLLSNKADPNLKDHSGYTAVHSTIASQNPDVFRIILENGGDVNIVTNAGFSPMFSLVTEVSCLDDDEASSDFKDVFVPIFQSLMTSGCDMNIKCIDHSTCLHFAVAERPAAVCDILAENGCDVNTKDYLNRTPLHMAARNKDSRVAEVLIRHGARTDLLDIHNDTPLHHACLWQNTAVVRFLLSCGADVNAVGDLGIQPIHLAAENGDELMLQILLASGADSHALDSDMATPLHYAASDGNPETTQYLLLNGVDKTKKDKAGHTPLDLALFRGQFRASTLLAENTNDVKFGNVPDGNFPNRPLLGESEIDGYFDKLGHSLLKLEGTASDKGIQILKSPGLGKVDLEAGENKIIYNSIKSLATEIFKRVIEMEPLFEGTLINAGSTAEKVKVGYPDEYDFVCHLEKFSELIADVQPAETDEYAKVKLKSPVPKEFQKFCILSEDTLNAGYLLIHFCRITQLAIYDTLSKKHPNLYSGFMLPHELANLYSDKAVPMQKLNGLSVSWRGNSFKILDISIDFNPVVFTNMWPKDAIKSSYVLPNVCDRGMYLIPKHCKKLLSIPPETIPSTSDLWRYSTHHLEEAMMRQLPSLGRDCYMLCKAFRVEPLSCAVNISKKDPVYQVSQENDTASSNSNDMGENTSDDEEEVDTSDDNGEMEAVSDTWNKLSGHDVSDKLDKASSALALFDGDDDDNEVTAESCIPSYYIKVLFLNEVEDMYRSQRRFTENDLQRIPRIVYERLATCFTEEKICSRFFPTQNIYFNSAFSNINILKIVKLRKCFSRNILMLLRKLGFE